MINQQLIDYIKQQFQRGLNKENIKKILLEKGWLEKDIEEAHSVVFNPAIQPAVSLPSTTIPSLPKATAILKEAWALYKQRLKTFLGIMLIPVLVTTVFLAILGGGTFFISKSESISGFALIIPLSILFFIIILLIQIWGQISLIYAVKDSHENIGIIESYRRGWRKISSYWWVTILTGLIITGGFLLFAVPGIIFSVWFSLAIYILIAEDLKGMNALLKSKEYVKGLWGAVLWRFLFIGLLTIIVFIAAFLILMFLRIPFVDSIINFAISLFLTPLFVAYQYSIYKKLKVLKGEFVFTPTSKSKIGYIVIGILGILIIPIIMFTTVLVSLNSARDKAMDASRAAETRQIQTALEIYYDNHTKYPFSLEELYDELGIAAFTDPKTNLPYEYLQKENGNDYELCYQAETKGRQCASGNLMNSPPSQSLNAIEYFKAMILRLK